METINIETIPNQTISYQENENFYELTFKEINGLMAVDVTINGDIILTGQRIVSDVPLIPYQNLQNGNFVITTDNQEYPYYTQFGITQFLNYASQQEIQAIIDAGQSNTTA